VFCIASTGKSTCGAGMVSIIGSIAAHGTKHSVLRSLTVRIVSGAMLIRNLARKNQWSICMTGCHGVSHVNNCNKHHWHGAGTRPSNSAQTADRFTNAACGSPGNTGLASTIWSCSCVQTGRRSRLFGHHPSLLALDLKSGQRCLRQNNGDLGQAPVPS
jgi:hypothetical protein